MIIEQESNYDWCNFFKSSSSYLQDFAGLLGKSSKNGKMPLKSCDMVEVGEGEANCRGLKNGSPRAEVVTIWNCGTYTNNLNTDAEELFFNFYFETFNWNF